MRYIADDCKMLRCGTDTEHKSEMDQMVRNERSAIKSVHMIDCEQEVAKSSQRKYRDMERLDSNRSVNHFFYYYLLLIRIIIIDLHNDCI